MVVDPEGTPEQKKARGTHWVGKTFEEVRASDGVFSVSSGSSSSSSSSSSKDKEM